MPLQQVGTGPPGRLWDVRRGKPVTEDRFHPETIARYRLRAAAPAGVTITGFW